MLLLTAERLSEVSSELSAARAAVTAAKRTRKDARVVAKAHAIGCLVREQVAVHQLADVEQERVGRIARAKPFRFVKNFTPTTGS